MHLVRILNKTCIPHSIPKTTNLPPLLPGPQAVVGVTRWCEGKITEHRVQILDLPECVAQGFAVFRGARALEAFSDNINPRICLRRELVGGIAVLCAESLNKMTVQRSGGCHVPRGPNNYIFRCLARRS